MSKRISINGAADLKKLLARLVTDIIDAGGYARLHEHIRDALRDYDEEINQTPAFWSFAEQAIREATLIRLARVYDQNQRALSLLTLLHTIGHHKSFFEDASVLERMSSAYAEEFKPGSHVLDLKQLEADIQLVSDSDPVVNKIVRWRSNFGAHLSTQPILRAKDGGKLSITRDDVSELVSRAFSIYNRYLSAFEGASYSTKIIGEETHDFLFKMLRAGLQKMKDDAGEQWP